MNHIYNLIDKAATEGGTISILVLLFLICGVMYFPSKEPTYKDFGNMFVGALLGIISNKYRAVKPTDEISKKQEITFTKEVTTNSANTHDDNNSNEEQK